MVSSRMSVFNVEFSKGFTIVFYPAAEKHYSEVRPRKRDRIGTLAAIGSTGYGHGVGRILRLHDCFAGAPALPGFPPAGIERARVRQFWR